MHAVWAKAWPWYSGVRCIHNTQLRRVCTSVYMAMCVLAPGQRHTEFHYVHGSVILSETRGVLFSDTSILSGCLLQPMLSPKIGPPPGVRKTSRRRENHVLAGGAAKGSQAPAGDLGPGKGNIGRSPSDLQVPPGPVPFIEGIATVRGVSGEWTSFRNLNGTGRHRRMLGDGAQGEATRRADGGGLGPPENRGDRDGLLDSILHPADTLEERLRCIPDNQEALERAMEHARAGRMVLPCTYRSDLPWKDYRQKKPAAKDHGLLDATTNETTLARKFRFRWARLVGIRTGEANGVAVLDVDEAGMPWLAEHPEVLRGARVVRTPSGGVHVYFQHASGLRGSADDRITTGVHVRAEGNYVIDYAAAGCEVLQPVAFGQLPPFPPKWLEASMRKPNAHDHTAPRGRKRANGTAFGSKWMAARDLADAAEQVRKATEGARNSALNTETFSVAARWQGVLADNEIGDAMREAAADAGLGPREVENTIRSALSAVKEKAAEEAKSSRRRRLLLSEEGSTGRVAFEEVEWPPRPASPYDDTPTPAWPERQPSYSDGMTPRERWYAEWRAKVAAGILPRIMLREVATVANNLGIDKGPTTMGFLAATAGAAPKAWRFETWPGFRVPPNQWVGLVAPSGARKSPLLERVKIGLDRAEAAFRKEHAEEIQRWQADKAHAEEAGQKFTDPPPRLRRLVLEDFNQEAAVERLAAVDPRGIMVVQDEVAALLAGELYTGHKQRDRGFLLKARGCGSYHKDRVSSRERAKPELFISCAGMAVFGGIQPAKLRSLRDINDDGTLARFALVPFSGVTVRELDAIVHEQYELSDRIAQLAGLGWDGEKRLYRCSRKAAEIVKGVEHFGADLAAASADDPPLAGFAGKPAWNVRRSRLPAGIDRAALLVRQSAARSGGGGGRC